MKGLKGNEINSSQSKEFTVNVIYYMNWNKMVTYVNFKRDYKSLRKSSLFFLTTPNTTELNQSETWYSLGL